MTSSSFLYEAIVGGVGGVSCDSYAWGGPSPHTLRAPESSEKQALACQVASDIPRSPKCIATIVKDE